MSRWSLFLLLLLLTACTGQSANGDDDKRDDCERLRDHTIDLRLRTSPRSRNLSAEDLERHRATMLVVLPEMIV